MINIYTPSIAPNQARYIEDAVQKNELTFHGKYHKEFKKSLSTIYESHCSLTCNGTVSLFAILKSLPRENDKDEVILPSLTYVASTSQIIHAGYRPVFVNSDENFQINIHDVFRVINPKTLAVMVPTLFADAPDLKLLRKICDDNNIFMIEDAAEAFLCYERGQLVGTFGHASSFSFFANKVITTGEGGCVLTKDEDLAKRVELFINHNCIGPYQHSGPGSNFRMTNLCAAIGVAQLEDVKRIIKNKKYIASFYRNNLSCSSIVPTIEDSSEWMPVFKLPRNFLYPEFRQRMLQKNIDTRPMFTPNHLIKNIDYVNRVDLDCEVIREYQRFFSLPCSPDLTDEQLTYIVDSANSCMS